MNKIQKITAVRIVRYPDNGQVKAFVEWVDTAGTKGGTEGDPKNLHMNALIRRAKREGVRLEMEGAGRAARPGRRSRALKSKHFAVVGRIPGGDEDSVLFFKATGAKRARQYFDREIYRQTCDTPARVRLERREVKAAHGQTVFITHVISSRSKFTLE